MGTEESKSIVAIVRVEKSAGFAVVTCCCV